MVYEWDQHNIAYDVLTAIDNRFTRKMFGKKLASGIESAKHADINPGDQGKSWRQFLLAGAFGKYYN